MKFVRFMAIVSTPLIVISCSITPDRGTLGQLRNVQLVLKDKTVDNGLEKAMESYREFLKETPESALTPEAIRRIADLSIEKEYGYIDEGSTKKSPTNATLKTRELDSPEINAISTTDTTASIDISSTEISDAHNANVHNEGDTAFEDRATRSQAIASNPSTRDALPVAGSDLENANARQAVELYKKLLKEYPFYDRNDQVLYQLSRAYEELGEVENAMNVMNQFIASYPESRYLDEIQFRRAEFYFTRKKYLDAEDAYKAIVTMGPTSYYYELALYKLGWTFYKQQLYEEALGYYIALLDYKVSIGYDFSKQIDPIESKRVEDIFRVISLSFSNLGGADVTVDFFRRVGSRGYEDKVYSNLGEFYLSKRRYADAAGAYNAFIDNHPYHELSPHFAMRTIDIYKQGRFAQLVIEAKKNFAKTYAVNSTYWQHFDFNSRTDVVDFLKGNLKDLANHYHALFQDKRFAKEKSTHYAQALVWYKTYLDSFPQEEESPGIHYQMADLMLENKDFGQAAVAYEYTSYNYPGHEQSSAAGYAAVYAYREQLKVVDEFARKNIKQEVIRTSLKFADSYPNHKKVTLVLGAAADDLYGMKNFELAVKTARQLIDSYPNAESKILRSAWLVVGHGCYDLAEYSEAETGYLQVLAFTEQDDDSRAEITDNLAASIYKQGEESNLAGEYQTAANHFLRVGKLAPASSIRPNAEYDAATALIELQQWSQATDVLLGFRKRFPDHELQKEITKKIALVYKSDGKLELAAAEYERIEAESDNEDVRRGALLLAAELYAESELQVKELAIYSRFVKYFPTPVESALEIYAKMAGVYFVLDNNRKHSEILRKIVEIDKTAGNARTDRTRYLAAEAALTLAKPYFEQFADIKIVAPIEKNINRKKKSMKKAINAYTALLDYGVADITAAATYYMAEIYFNFSRALMNSERPANLSDLELEEYELALEDQIYPFEEKSISVHKKNVELLYVGVYSQWIDKSINKLADLFPALYARDEEHTGFVETIDAFQYIIFEPQPEATDSNETYGLKQVENSDTTAGNSSSPIEDNALDSHSDRLALSD